MIRGLVSLYSWRLPLYLVELWRRYPNAWTYMRRFWQTTNLSVFSWKSRTDRSSSDRKFALLLYGWLILQVTVGMALTVYGLMRPEQLPGMWQIGLAIFLAYPIVLVYILVILKAGWWLMHPKALGRAVLCTLLEAQVIRLRKRSSVKVVAVAGSVGKTSTKIAIARTLEASRRVQWQEGNYNDRVTVPLIFFGHSEPGIFNVPAWIKILIANERTLRKPYPYQVVVVEIGTDMPGKVVEFAYLKPDVTVITAVSAEHMEYFKTLDAVAEEELATLRFSKQALVNIDDTPGTYLHDRDYLSYGLTKEATYYVTERTHHARLAGQNIRFKLGKTDSLTLDIPLLGDQGAKIAIAAAATAHVLGVPLQDIEKGISTISAFAGRMQILYGIKNSTLIDDTYNASPVASKAALDVLQAGDAPQRIAILGSMNELGDYTEEAHKEVAEHCDPSKLDWVVTVGEAANKYLAPLAKERGCKVKKFWSPYKAGLFVKNQLKEGAVVLAKGSQNRVFTEESLKPLLKDKKDAEKLVRQSAYWMNIKQQQFN